MDDNGSADEHRFVTVAGYLADEGSWEGFEAAWRGALHEAGIPWLHMREFGGPTNPTYAPLRADGLRHINFMLDAVQAIADNLHVCVHATVDMNALRAFVAKHDLEIDPIALALYGCLLKMRQSIHAREPIEIFVDRFDKSESRIAKALQYARAEAVEDLQLSQTTFAAVKEPDSWRSVPPLQAADFVAWEIRKWFEDRRSFDYTVDDKAQGHSHMSASYLKWLAEQEQMRRKPLPERKSYLALRRALGILPMGVLFDEFNLEQMLNSRPSGWTV